MQMFQPSIPQTLGKVVSQSISSRNRESWPDDVGNVDRIVGSESVSALLFRRQAVAGLPQDLDAVGWQGLRYDEVALFFEPGPFRFGQAMRQAGRIHAKKDRTGEGSSKRKARGRATFLFGMRRAFP